MRKLIFLSIFAIVICMASCTKDTGVGESSEAVAINQIEPQSESGNVVPDQYIVIFKESFIKPASAYIEAGQFKDRNQKASTIKSYIPEIESKIEEFLLDNNIDLENVLFKYSVIDAGVAVKLTNEQFKAISTSPVIESIEHDRKETIDFKVEDDNVENKAVQTTTCAITNAGGAGVASAGKWIWIVDSGIDLDHPDLNVQTNTSFAKSFIGGTANDDCLGHGTHVAGIAAAKNNSYGVVGMAPGALVVPIRVINCSNAYYNSDLLAGLNHVNTYDIAGDVVNMSLGGSYGSSCANNSPFKSAVQNFGNAGTWVVSAAGNGYGASAANQQPGCINGNKVLTIASMDCNKTFSSFSNVGKPPIDWIATGRSVYSTYKNGGYTTMSGTSMATPVVAGICQVKNNYPTYGGFVFKNGAYYSIAKK